MKKSVLMMAGLLTVALAGSAQAATMFAVQDATPTDRFTVSDQGMINEAGTPTQIGGAFGGQLSKVPPQDGTGTKLLNPAGVFHVASEGRIGAGSAFLVQHAAWPNTPGGTDFVNAMAPNFSFYRINRNDVTLAYSLPNADNFLGYFNFGSINTASDPNSGASRKNVAIFSVRAEKAWTSLTDTATYFAWGNSVVGAAILEKMRLSSAGNLGIGTTTPTSKLSVVGLPVCPDNTTAKTATPTGCGLLAGAFYVQGPVGGVPTNGTLMIAY